MRICKRRRRFAIYIFSAAVCLGIIFGFFLVRIENPFFAEVEAHSQAAANDAVCAALEEADIKYSDFITLLSDESGRVNSMSADGIKISRVKAELAKKIQKSIEESNAERVWVPVFSFQKNPVLSGAGPRVCFKIKPASLVSLEFRDSFTSTGINQTRHTIYIEAFITINITSSFVRKTETIHNSILAADTVIVGDVPKYYGSGGIITEKADN